MAQDLTQEIIEIYNTWDKIYPERFAPGEIPYETYHFAYPIFRETTIQKRIRNMITHGKSFNNTIDYRFNPELAPKKYYSDGIVVDWWDLDKSNNEYERRCEKHEFGLPGIETAIIMHRKRN